MQSLQVTGIFVLSLEPQRLGLKFSKTMLDQFAKQIIHMECQTLFSLKNKIRMLSAAV